VALSDDISADLAGGGQDPKEIPTRRWAERVSEASRVFPEHRGASVSAAWPPGELPDQHLDRLEVATKGLATRTSAALLIDCEEDRTLQAELVGMLREADR
jgi:hypothetical protein